MSALGDKRTYAAQKGMSALHPKADICSAPAHIRYGPIADIVPFQSSSHLDRLSHHRRVDFHPVAMMDGVVPTEVPGYNDDCGTNYKPDRNKAVQGS